MNPIFYRPVGHEHSFDRLFDVMCRDLISAPSVATGHWQAKKDVPQTASRELLNVQLTIPIAASPGAWAAYMKPNLPWANEHFAERVSGEPLNPPPSHVGWPFNQRGNADHVDDQGVFSHSYPERLWPKFAPTISGPYISGYGKNPPPGAVPRHGIRYPYGDLSEAISLLVREPHTRQCYIPLWFPEDLHAAAVEQERVPCTLGYHMILRHGLLYCFYPMRSLDVLRYLRDDAYMAGRLVQWIIDRCRLSAGENSVWHDVMPGWLTMHIVSCHVFEGDISGIKHRLDKERPRLAA